MPRTVAALLTGGMRRLSSTHKHIQLTKKITMAHFPSQLKGKITRFPEQISSNEWFIISVKHGGSGIWSLRPLLVGLINHVITETGLDRANQVLHNVKANLYSQQNGVVTVLRFC